MEHFSQRNQKSRMYFRIRVGNKKRRIGLHSDTAVSMRCSMCHRNISIITDNKGEYNNAKRKRDIPAGAGADPG